MTQLPPIYLHSSLSNAQMLSVGQEVMQIMSKCSRMDGSLQLTEGQAKNVLKPLINDGYKIRSDLKLYPNNKVNLSEQLTQDDYDLLNSLDDCQLAALSLISYTNTAGTTVLANGTLTTSDVFNCIGSALGIGSSVCSLGVQGLISAKTGLAILKAMAKRYCFGYISLAICVYQFVDCIHDLQTKQIPSNGFTGKS